MCLISYLLLGLLWATWVCALCLTLIWGDLQPSLLQVWFQFLPSFALSFFFFLSFLPALSSGVLMCVYFTFCTFPFFLNILSFVTDFFLHVATFEISIFTSSSLVLFLCVSQAPVPIWRELSFQWQCLISSSLFYSLFRMSFSVFVLSIGSCMLSTCFFPNKDFTVLNSDSIFLYSGLISHNSCFLLLWQESIF